MSIFFNKQDLFIFLISAITIIVLLTLYPIYSITMIFIISFVQTINLRLRKKKTKSKKKELKPLKLLSLKKTGDQSKSEDTTSILKSESSDDSFYGKPSFFEKSHTTFFSSVRDRISKKRMGFRKINQKD